jgi:flagellar motor component MotA
MKYSKFKSIYLQLESISSYQELPIGAVLAKNLSKMKKIITEKEEEIEKIVQKYAILDEKGELLGIKQEDGTRKDLKKSPYTYDEIDVEDREKFQEEIKKVMDSEVEFEPISISSSKKIFVKYTKEDDKKGVITLERQSTLIDELEQKLVPVAISFLIDNNILLED